MPSYLLPDSSHSKKICYVNYHITKTNNSYLSRSKIFTDNFRGYYKRKSHSQKYDIVLPMWLHISENMKPKNIF